MVEVSTRNIKAQVVHANVVPRVLFDDTDLLGRVAGGVYAKYGIDPHAGAIVVIRPDGYVGTVTPLHRADELKIYFGPFLV